MLDIKLKDWSMKDRQTNRTLAFGLWNGKISIQVYDSNAMGTKFFRRNLNDEELLLVEKVINKVMAGSPETKCSCQFQKYDFQSKQFKIEAVFSFEKDSKQCYHLSVTDCTKQQTSSFLIKAPSTMTMGSEPLNDSNLSALKVESLKDWITNAKIWAPATVQPIDKSKFGNRGGNGGGYGGGNRGGYGGGAPAPAAEAPAGGEGGGDSLPF